MCVVLFFFFFFSSRRRHTRFDCDWSSDVCSSDLGERGRAVEQGQSDAVVWLPLLQALTLLASVQAGQATAQGVHLPAHLLDEHAIRSEEHTSELQSQSNLVCRLLLEKKKYDGI